MYPHYGYGYPPFFPPNEMDLEKAIRFLQKLERKRIKQEEKNKKRKNPPPKPIPTGVVLAWLIMLSPVIGLGQVWLAIYTARHLTEWLQTLVK